MKTILSLFDYTGSWAKPYAERGYEVITVDIQHLAEQFAYVGRRHLVLDLSLGESLEILCAYKGQIQGILMAPPCTDFSGSGAQYWAAKDSDGRTDYSISLVYSCLTLRDVLRPAWWCLENPVGRLPRYIGPYRETFHPCDYGDPYTKKTCLWGEFVMPPKTPVEPVMYTTKSGKRGSYFWAKLGGKSPKTKMLRSITPPGFAAAFCEANP